MLFYLKFQFSSIFLGVSYWFSEFGRCFTEFVNTCCTKKEMIWQSVYHDLLSKLRDNCKPPVQNSTCLSIVLGCFILPRVSSVRGMALQHFSQTHWFSRDPWSLKVKAMRFNWGDRVPFSVRKQWEMHTRVYTSTYTERKSQNKWVRNLTKARD